MQTRETTLTPSLRAIRCRHRDYAHLKIDFDFSELWDGAPENKPGIARWGGGFTGRPLLAAQLFPTIQAVTHVAKTRVIQSRRSYLRIFFRFLDGYERWCDQQNSAGLATKITKLEDITTHHLQMWKTPSPTGEWQQPDWSTYRGATQILSEATNRLGTAHLIVPAHARKDAIDRRDLPEEIIGRALVKALAKDAIRIWALWERSDALAEKGRNFVGESRVPLLLNGHDTGYTTIIVEGGVTEADLHATYRAAIAANDDLPLGKKEFMRVWGYDKVVTPSWWPRYGTDHRDAGKSVEFADLQAGLYPTADELGVLFLLFLARTGWNQSTAEMLDISNESNWCKEYTKKFVWLFSYKPRAAHWQDTVSFKNHRTGAYQIIKRLMARTDKLRQAIEGDPALCNNFEIAKRSPWLYQRTSQKDKNPVRVELRSDVLTDILQRVITSYNKQQADSAQHIPTRISPSDLRDIFAAVTYSNSGFSVFLTQLALGHKRISTAFHYLRRRAWRAESEKKKNDMFVALIDQIETHRIVDLTLLRANMDGIMVTETQIARLEAHRKSLTYVGLGCSDPTHPPTFIDPTNPRDGTTPCAQGHLCAGCPKGRVFNDSLPSLGRRCAELESLRDTLPLDVFQNSSLADQLLVTRATLKQWPAKDVDSHVGHWAAKIACGEHRPIRFSGEH